MELRKPSSTTCKEKNMTMHIFTPSAVCLVAHRCPLPVCALESSTHTVILVYGICKVLTLSGHDELAMGSSRKSEEDHADLGLQPVDWLEWGHFALALLAPNSRSMFPSLISSRPTTSGLRRHRLLRSVPFRADASQACHTSQFGLWPAYPGGLTILVET